MTNLYDFKLDGFARVGVTVFGPGTPIAHIIKRAQFEYDFQSSNGPNPNDRAVIQEMRQLFSRPCWIPPHEYLPPDRRPVIALYEDKDAQLLVSVCVLRYFGHHKVKVDHRSIRDFNAAEYVFENGLFSLPEGWYKSAAGYSQHQLFHEKVLGWMDLPPYLQMKARSQP